MCLGAPRPRPTQRLPGVTPRARSRPLGGPLRSTTAPLPRPKPDIRASRMRAKGRARPAPCSSSANTITASPVPESRAVRLVVLVGRFVGDASAGQRWFGSATDLDSYVFGGPLAELLERVVRRFCARNPRFESRRLLLLAHEVPADASFLVACRAAGIPRGSQTRYRNALKVCLKDLFHRSVGCRSRISDLGPSVKLRGTNRGGKNEARDR